MDRFLVILTPTALGWTATAPEVPGISASGATRAIALHNVRAAIADHLARLGRPGVEATTRASLDYVDLAGALPRPLPALPEPAGVMPSDLAARLTAAGLVIVDLGGGASALFTERDGAEVFIRSADGRWAPRTLDGPVIVEETVRGLREVGSPLEDDVDTAEFGGYTLREVIEALERPDDEYATLESRLAHGQRPGGKEPSR